MALRYVRGFASSANSFRTSWLPSKDGELAVDAMELVTQVDEMVLFSGDGDLRSLVQAVQHHGVRVTVVSTIAIQPPMIADNLRRQVDVFVDLKDLQAKIGRDPSESPEPRNHSL